MAKAGRPVPQNARLHLATKVPSNAGSEHVAPEAYRVGPGRTGLWVMHPLLGPVLVEGPRFVLSRTPGQVRGAGPIYGQHTEEVLALLAALRGG